jgi:exodeoxyribonuclease-3
MKIASWNVNSVRARLDHIRDWLQSAQPDVLLLQELKGLEFPAAEFAALGYQSEAVTQKAYNGVAILSRSPIAVQCAELPGDGEDLQARYIEASIEDLRIVALYLPNGNPLGAAKYEYKLRWMARLHSHLQSLLDQHLPVVVGGDFNVIPEEIDCFRPADWLNDALFQPAVRAAFHSLIEIGYTDAFRALHPGQPGHYTYWDYFRQAFPRNRGIRIDHFLLSPLAAARLHACEIDPEPRRREKPSDHTPIVLHLR